MSLPDVLLRYEGVSEIAQGGGVVVGVLTALLVGIVVGSFLRPFLDAYLASKTAQYYASEPVRDGAASESCPSAPRTRDG